MSEKNLKNKNNNYLSKEEENMLKEAIIFLQKEYNIKKEKIKLLKQELSIMKKAFQNQIQEYQKEIKLTIDKENDIQQLFSKISKLKKRRALIIKNSFNNIFYTHLLEISENKKKEKILKNFFSLILLENKQETRTAKELLEILKNKDEIKNLLSYSYKIYSDLRENDEKKYFELKEKFDNYILELKELNGEYSLDELFECHGIIFEIIEYDKEIKEKNCILNKLIEKKNAKFVEIKSIELKIRNYYKNNKKIHTQIKIIQSFYENFKELNDNNDLKNLRELLENIEEYKKIDFNSNKMNNNLDAITSLTFGTYCSQSEDSSLKSCTLGSKNGIKLFNNKFKKSTNKKNEHFNLYESMGNLNKNKFKNKTSSQKFNKSLKNSQMSTNFTNTRSNTNNIIVNEISQEKIYSNINNKNIQNKFGNNQNNNLIINKNEEKKMQAKDNNKNNALDEKKIDEKKETVNNKKFKNTFSNLLLLGAKINQLKYREPDDSVEMTIPKETKNINIVNTENNINDSSVCDEMISFNYEIPNKFGKNTTNDYINKIGVKNNVVFSQELYKNKWFMKRNNDFGNLTIEKSIETSSCCVCCS